MTKADAKKDGNYILNFSILVLIEISILIAFSPTECFAFPDGIWIQEIAKISRVNISENILVAQYSKDISATIGIGEYFIFSKSMFMQYLYVSGNGCLWVNPTILFKFCQWHSKHESFWQWARQHINYSANFTIFSRSLPEILNEENNKDRSIVNIRALNGWSNISTELPFLCVVRRVEGAEPDKYEYYRTDCDPSIWVTYPFLKRIAGLSAFVIAGIIMLLVGFWGLTLHSDISHFIIVFFAWLVVLSVLWPVLNILGKLGNF